MSPPVCKPSCLFPASPSGWDNEKKIAILHENFQTVKADDGFEDVVVKPPVRKVMEAGRGRRLGAVGVASLILSRLAARSCTKRRSRQKMTRCFW